LQWKGLRYGDNWQQNGENGFLHGDESRMLVALEVLEALEALEALEGFRICFKLLALMRNTRRR
jgi:hypothetical protein